MDKVLLVGNEGENLECLRSIAKKAKHFELRTVSDQEKAIWSLDNDRIAVLVIDHLDSLNIDGLELLAYVSRNHSSIPCILMTSYGKPLFRDKVGQKDSIYILKKPFQDGSLVSAVFVALDLRDENSVSDGIMIRSFLPLIDMEQRTCNVSVEAPGKGKGFLYFDNGELIDAFYNKESGEDAAREIACWKSVRVEFGELRRRKRRRPFTIDAMELAGAEWRDENPEKKSEEADDLDSAALLPDMSEETVAAELFGIHPEPGESPRPGSELETALQNNGEALTKIPGCKALGLLDEKGVVHIIGPVDDSIDLEKTGVDFDGIFSRIADDSRKAGFDGCRTVTIQTEEYVFLLFSFKTNEKILGVVSADGNWFYLKNQIESIASRVIGK